MDVQLLKIPCALAVAIACHISWTAPTQPTSEEKIPVRGMAERWLMFGMAILTLLKGTYWLLGMAEITSILTNKLHATLPATHSRLLDGVLSTLARGENVTITLTSAIGLFLIVIGTWMRYTCYQELGRHFTFELTIVQKHKLVTTGPYALLRHPGYASISIWYIGMVLWHGSSRSWVRASGILETTPGLIYLGFFTFYIVGVYIAVMGRVKKEDKRLKEVFGQEWERWAKRVPYAVIPGVW